MTMNNPLTILKPAERQIVVMILTMLDGKPFGTICDILDIINFFLNSAAGDFNDDDDIFKLEHIKNNLLEGLKND